MLHFIGFAFLQSFKWAILFINTRDRSTFTFKLKLHYVCFNLRPGEGGGHCHIWATYVFAVTSGRVFLSSSVWRVDSGTPHPKFRICSPFVLVLRRKSFCINIAFFRYKSLSKKRLDEWVLLETCYEFRVKKDGVTTSQYEISGKNQICSVKTFSSRA